MKSVLISIQPRWCELIAPGKKTIEVRKTKPNLDVPFKVYIYCTKDKNHSFCTDDGNRYTHIGNGKVIGEFVCDKIENIEIRHFTVFGHENLYTAVGENPDNQWLKHSCLSYDEVVRYGKHAPLYGWHISDLVIYDKPKELAEFYIWKKCNSCRETGYESTACRYDEDCRVPAVITRPPQSWCYVESIEQQ